MTQQVLRGTKASRFFKPIMVMASALGLASTSFASVVPASASSLVSMTIGVQAPLPLFAPFFLIQKNPSLCAQFGVDPSFATVNPVSGPPALLSGSVPLQVESNGSFFEEAAKSPSSITLLGGYGPIAAWFWVAKDIKTLAQLKGTTLAATTVGGASDLLARLTIKLAGLQAGTAPGDVHIDYVGSPLELIALTESGRTSGYSDPPPMPPAVVAAGIHPILKLTLYPQAIPVDALAVVVSGPYLRAHQSAVHGMLECIANADLRAVAEKSATESAIESVLNYPPSLAAASFTDNESTWNIFTFTKSLAEKAIADLKAAGLASEVAGFSYSSDDLTALAGIKGALPGPPGSSSS